MILTSDFVYIHQPKTGGTFVTKVLERLYPSGEGPPGKRGRLINTHKHGTCSEVPEEWRGKPLLTTLRNPYDRYVSQYRFAWWKRYPDMYCGEDEMRAMFPHYPELSFGDFLLLANTKFVNRYQRQETGFRNEHFPEERRLGWHTEQFVRFYCRQPREVFRAIDEAYIAEGRCRQDMFPVRFTFSESLNGELHAFLREAGHAPEDIAFILDAAKIYPEEGGRAPEDRWESYYTPELKHLVRTRERLIFELFPQYDV
ncbi:hypothetical protein POL68_22995 [Stigmatella sp. ncwal1]|uniref:Sulfotransferase family protein n=1 Tax=Stigmatella ashevillensis TaxID=2995309 RepID=A0ABT5DCJ5_9BACT|nr:hypothetical protein [Stigmatella ashevillena]MDC0711356.1 hypothetical protein [Stigmatella ashevillena]